MIYAITSLSREQATVEQLEAFWRGHWTIENRVDRVRDVTFGEDRCQLRAGNAAHAMTILRNVVLTLFRFNGWDNIPSALRWFGSPVARSFALIGITRKMRRSSSNGDLDY